MLPLSVKKGQRHHPGRLKQIGLVRENNVDLVSTKSWELHHACRQLLIVWIGLTHVLKNIVSGVVGSSKLIRRNVVREILKLCRNA
jgi:hypothetical protein